MSSRSSSSESNKSDNVIIIEKDDTASGGSNKQRFSHAYQYFTFDESMSRWNCNHCE